MERLVRIAAVLKVSGEQGVSADKLVKVAEFEGEDALDQLSRDLRLLRKQGWQIDRITPEGVPAVYRMVTVDNRFRVKLSPAQQRALQRAALVADRADLVKRLGLPEGERPQEVPALLPLSGHDERLSAAVKAVQSRCVMRFRYNGKDRVVHPESVRSQNERWYLRACEEGGDILKLFVITHMGDVHVDAPGTAARVSAEPRLELHPMRWKLDPPVVVTLRTTKDHVDDVERWLGAPRSVTATPDSVDLEYSVTNRSGLRVRLYELGQRVQIVGPDDVRQELLDELAAAAGEVRS
jgi:predicted DNA-binding transcriptional regulator YafY